MPFGFYLATVMLTVGIGVLTAILVLTEFKSDKTTALVRIYVPLLAFSILTVAPLRLIDIAYSTGLEEGVGTPGSLSALQAGDVFRVIGASEDAVIFKVDGEEQIYAYENADELPSWVAYDSFYRILRKARVEEIRERIGNPAPGIYWVSV